MVSAASFDDLLPRMSFAESRLPLLVQRAYRSLIASANESLDMGGVPAEGRRTWVVPGRIEILGKHVDYAGGRSLLCCLERGTVIVARPNLTQSVVVRDAKRREAVSITFDAARQGSLPWFVYPHTVLRRLRNNFGAALLGADIGIASNLPPAAGVSSSSALVVGLTIALVALSELTILETWKASIPNRLALAGYIGALENGASFGDLAGEAGVGTMGGAQDQTAILCCENQRLDQFGWAPVKHESFAELDDSHVFAVAVSGAVAAKTGSAKERYNRAARTAARLVHAWNENHSPRASTLREVLQFAAASDEPTQFPGSLADFARMAANEEFDKRHLESRLNQFFDETFIIVPEATRALNARQYSTFGALVDASQRGAEMALENQIAETVSLVRSARKLGATAASSFGAGFGGSVWAMIPTDQAAEFTARWKSAYVSQFPSRARRASFFTTRPSASAFELTDHDPDERTYPLHNL